MAGGRWQVANGKQKEQKTEIGKLAGNAVAPDRCQLI